VIGAILWICAFVLAGYFFGSIPLVQDNFNYIIYAIIGISLLAVGSIIVGVFRSVQECPVPDERERSEKK
jgi:membrane protein DedA with SNARE-associated domain